MHQSNFTWKIWRVFLGRFYGEKKRFEDVAPDFKKEWCQCTNSAVARIYLSCKSHEARQRVRLDQDVEAFEAKEGLDGEIVQLWVREERLCLFLFWDTIPGRESRFGS